MYCKLNHNLDCDCCGVCRGEQEEEKKPVDAKCYLCGCWIDEDEECYVILDKIICQDCVSNSYFETLKEALEEDAR